MLSKIEEKGRQNMNKIFQQDLTKEEKVGGIFIRAEDLITRRSAS